MENKLAIFGALLLLFGLPLVAADLQVKQWYPQGADYVFVCDLDDTATTYNWFFGDGNKQFETTQREVFHRYDSSGMYEVRCEANTDTTTVIDTLKVDVGPTIVELAETVGIFDTLLTAVDTAMLTDTLKTAGPFTVFAPTDAAFAEVGITAVNDLLNDKEALTNVLLYHVASGEQTAADLIGKESVKTLQGTSAPLEVIGNDLFIDGVRVSGPNNFAVNGVVHIIEEVLMPPVKESGEEYAKMNVKEWYPQGKDFVFTCESSIHNAHYNYHFGDGAALHEVTNDNVFHRYQTSGTYNAWCEATNGVATARGDLSVVAGDIVDVATDAGIFRTLLFAATEAGLVDTLRSQGPYTVFAPTDAAFEKIDPVALTEILANEDKLRQVLLYHVVPGREEASSLTTKTSISTAQGQALDLALLGSELLVDGVPVQTPDVPATNGVVHIIDEVLMPDLT